jgi:hypothetical protein
MPRKEPETKAAQVGVAAFVIGLLIAIIFGIWQQNVISHNGVILVLGFLGIIVGLLNIEDRELDRYLLANIAFLVAAATATGAFNVFLTTVPLVSMYLSTIVANIVAFVAPGAAIVALKELYEVSRR